MSRDAHGPLWPIPGSLVEITAGGSSARATFNTTALNQRPDYIVVVCTDAECHWRTGDNTVIALTNDPVQVRSPAAATVFRKRRGDDSVACITDGTAGTFYAYLAKELG